jgi:hypothetical protein
MTKYHDNTALFGNLKYAHGKKVKKLNIAKF